MTTTLKDLRIHHPEMEPAIVAQAFQNVFNNEDGAMVLQDLAREFHLIGTTYDEDSPQTIYVNEGARNALLYILSQLGQDVSALIKLAQEV